MKYKKNITGQKFNLLTVVKYSHTKKGHGSYWECVCDCGGIAVVRIDSLRAGSPKSCGCLTRKWQKTGNANRTHGKSKTRVYSQWLGIKRRCLNKNYKDYQHYGGRGIKFCKRWTHFENFYKDMGGCPPEYTIERIDNDGDYKKSNCKWIHKSKQNLNKRTSIVITFNGQTKCLSQWAKYLDINYSTLHKRIRYSGKSHTEILGEIYEYKNL